MEQVTTPQPEVPGGYRNRPVSWVRRGVRMTEGQQIALDAHGAKYLIEPPRGLARESIAPGWQMDLASIFGDAFGEAGKPVVLEIGTGRGENIIAAATRHSDMNFVGVEVYGPGLARTILHAELEGGLPNMRLIQADALEVLKSLPDRSIAQIWIFFPDPWPKTKHQKRRLIDDDFAKEIARVLCQNGEIRLATDWLHYATQMREVFDQSPLFDNTTDGERFEGRVLTAFEGKAHRAGREITDLTYRLR